MLVRSQGKAAFIWIANCALMLFVSAANATETDNFTNRPADPGAITDHSVLDAWSFKANQLLEASLAGVKGCDLKALHMAIKEKLGGGEVGRFEFWATTNPDLKKTVVPQDQSIYADAGLLTVSIGIAVTGIVPSFAVAGHYVGADKLGHFFDQGYDYYEAIYIHNKGAATTLETKGSKDEEGINGMLGNGIRSYADMAANFSGYLFWRDVVGGASPYFECKDGKFARTSRKFNWADYINDAWDESINCSEFSSLVSTGVKKALTKLGVTCPVQPKACEKIASQLCGRSYLSPACLPHIKPVTVPDAACLKLIEVDQSASTACFYEPDLLRSSNVKVLFELNDGLTVMEEEFTSRKQAELQNWAEKKKEQAAQQVRRLWKFIHP